MRRSRLDIICSFLSALEQDPMRPTPLMHMTNLPYDLFTKYVRELENTGLIKSAGAKKMTVYSLTPKGELYLKEYRLFLKFSASFGL